MDKMITFSRLFKFFNVREKIQFLKQEDANLREILIRYDQKSKCAKKFEITFLGKLLWASLGMVE